MAGHSAARVRRYAAGRARTLGVATRGTTAPNRLRRNDNWLATWPGLTQTRNADVLVVDLGYGASAVTTVELAARLHRQHPDVRVLGLEIEPARVAMALPFARPPRLDFALGGFELAGHRPALVRAMNVLRQYDEEPARQAWTDICSRLATGGALVEGTCDEIGRVGSWVLVTAAGPQSLTLSCSVQHLEHPRTLAQRLPKALIHHNIPGRAIHRLLTDLGAAWDQQAPLAVFSGQQRWAAAVDTLRTDWPILDRPRRHRFGELTVTWAAIDPLV